MAQDAQLHFRNQPFPPRSYFAVPDVGSQYLGGALGTISTRAYNLSLQMAHRVPQARWGCWQRGRGAARSAAAERWRAAVRGHGAGRPVAFQR